LLDFGLQALSNRYLQGEHEQEQRFSFRLGQCGNCGTIQVQNPIPVHELKARFDWIRYNEQEAHLDDMVAKILALHKLTERSVIGAISFKDDTTLARFEKLGFKNLWRLSLDDDLGLSEALAGLETVQAMLTPGNADKILQRRPKADVLIVRHILEHAHAPATFVQALRRLVVEDGLLVFEVPDCAPALERKDYTMFWEEHICYFTPELFKQALSLLGLPVIHFERYLYSNENSLVAFAQNGSARSVIPDQTIANGLLKIGRGYADSFGDYKQKVRDALGRCRAEMGRMALFGAGHLSCAWLNFLEVADEIDFVVDDHPKKRGLFMPGSRLPIKGSAELLSSGIGLCLLTLSPESEKKVIEKNQAFVNQGGRFLSIFPGKANSLQL
jgi:hypothetical protein